MSEPSHHHLASTLESVEMKLHEGLVQRLVRSGREFRDNALAAGETAEWLATDAAYRSHGIGEFTRVTDSQLIPGLKAAFRLPADLRRAPVCPIIEPPSPDVARSTLRQIGVRSPGDRATVFSMAEGLNHHFYIHASCVGRTADIRLPRSNYSCAAAYALLQHPAFFPLLWIAASGESHLIEPRAEHFLPHGVIVG